MGRLFQDDAPGFIHQKNEGGDLNKELKERGKRGQNYVQSQ